MMGMARDASGDGRGLRGLTQRLHDLVPERRRLPRARYRHRSDAPVWLPTLRCRAGRTRHPHSLHGRQRAHRPDVDLGLGRGHARGAPDVPSRSRASGRGPWPALHGQLGELLPMGDGHRPRSVRPHPRAGARRSLGGRGRPVGGTGLQPAVRGVGVPPVPLRSALPGRAPRCHGDGRVQRRLLRALGYLAPALGGIRPWLLRLHAPGSRREEDRLPRFSLARHRRHRGPCLPHPLRLLDQRWARGRGDPEEGARTPRAGCRAREPP